MTMKVTRREVVGVTILDLVGRIALGDGNIVLRETVKELVDQGQRRILLNLGEVTYVDSAGLGELVRAYMLVHREGGEIKLLNPTRRVRNVLEITRLHTVFDVHESEDSAINAFSAEQIATPSSAQV